MLVQWDPEGLHREDGEEEGGEGGLQELTTVTSAYGWGLPPYLSSSICVRLMMVLTDFAVRMLGHGIPSAIPRPSP